VTDNKAAVALLGPQQRQALMDSREALDKELLKLVATWMGETARAAVEQRLLDANVLEDWKQIHADAELEAEEAETEWLLDEIARLRGLPCDEHFIHKFRHSTRQERHGALAALGERRSALAPATPAQAAEAEAEI